MHKRWDIESKISERESFRYVWNICLSLTSGFQPPVPARGPVGAAPHNKLVINVEAFSVRRQFNTEIVWLGQSVSPPKFTSHVFINPH